MSPRNLCKFCANFSGGIHAGHYFCFRAFAWNVFPASSIFIAVKFQTKPFAGILGIFFAVPFIPLPAMADNDDVAMTATNSLVASDSRFGLFDLLDHRSACNQEFFPQPLLVDDTGLEDGEFEFGSAPPLATK